jgi:hypothetical protein
MKGSRSCGGADGVEDEVEAARRLRHLARVGADDHLVRAERLGVRRLAGRGGEDDHVGAHRGGELDAHVAEAAEADDADLLARGRPSSGAAASRW